MDTQKLNMSKKVYIELELVLDIYSLVFWNIRFHLERLYGIEIDNQKISNLYGKPLKEGIKDIIAPKLAEMESKVELDIDDQVAQIIQSFKNSSPSLKPTVPSIHVLKQLKKDSNVQIYLFTYLDMAVVKEIIQPEFSKLVEGIMTVHEMREAPEQFSADINLLIFGCVAYYLEFETLATEKKVNLCHVQHAKSSDGLTLEIDSYKNLDQIAFETYNLPKLSPCYEGSLMRVELNREFKSSELPFWQTTIPLEKIELKGRVVNGFKRGSKELGVPTANLETCHDNIVKINNLLPGVYWGTIQFLSYESNESELRQKFGENFSEKKLMTALSIGWNPSYDNNQRTIEAYILEEFENDFYGEELKIEITHYIRAESNYTTLDHLIMAIHNDIETTKQTVTVQ